MTIRGIRGAIVASENTKAAILSATHDLLVEILAANPDLHKEDIASIFFTVTPDLDTTFPALAVRQFDWVHVPILCSQEIPVPGSLEKCIRILVHWNTNKKQEEIVHTYVGAAKVLRPDLNVK